MYADYFLTLTKTSADGMTMLVVPKSEGLTVRHMKMAGSGSAGTAFVDFDEVLVPVENVLGEIGKGLKCIMSNFNHEVCFFRSTLSFMRTNQGSQRLFISFQSLSCARVCLEDTIS